jgi:dolichol-phosphate mannosyltransferase
MSKIENNQATTLLDCSIVIPVYFNEGTLTQTLDNIKHNVIEHNKSLSFEVIFVDDGSGDGSFDELLQIRRQNPEIVKIIKLTRNFGQISALYAGFNHAEGRCVVAISADGQDPVELINQMLDEFTKGIEVVVATREDREESKFRIWTSRFFYKLMRKISFQNMPEGGFDYFLLGRRPLEAIIDSHDAHPFLQGQILWTGYSIKFLCYKRLKREVGTSRWSFGRKLTYLIDGVMSYSFLPIRLMSIMGLLVALSGFLYAAVILIDRIIWGNPVQGWAPIMIVLLVVSGIQLLMLGVIGEYVWRTLAQTRQRQSYLIDSIFE